ncbi:hypothetical protein [Pseudomonas sp.]|uniref:hypothetical protein n=1 Tax=Pseudomonas sp. TaxID=306 RepID=UPI003262CDA6
MSQSKVKAAGTLDPSFGTNGVVSTPFHDVVGSIPNAVLPLPGNQLLVVLGTTITQQTSTKVARLHEDGSLDMLFGRNGIVEIPFADGTWFAPRNLHPQANGGWLITGTAEHPDRGEELAVVRQLQDGRLDTSFGKKKDGKVLINIPELLGPEAGATAKLMTQRLPGNQSVKVSEGAQDAGVSVVNQADGKILLVSTVLFAFNFLRGIVLRLNQDGSLDETFAGKGFLLVEEKKISHYWNYASGVAVQEDGKVLVCGDFARENEGEWPDAYVIRYDQSGNVDKDYGENKDGLVTIDDADQWLEFSSITLRPDGGMIATGVAEAGLKRKGLIIALNPSGSFNRVFNDGLPLISDFPEHGASWRRSAFQKDHQGNVLAIIVAGQGGGDSLGDKSSLITARYRLDGKLDTTFGADGWVEFNDERAIDIFRGSVVMPDNKIVVCGFVTFGPQPLPGNILRYLG